MNYLRLAKVVCRSAYALLIVALVADSVVADTHLALTFLAIAPLLLFLPGLVRENHRTLAYLCFVTLLYFTAIVTNLFEPDKNLFTVLALIAVTLLFSSAMMYSRWLRAAANEQFEN
ncbi:MAG TPA: hypothetical protein DIT58_16895 [Porticoccaceae bacterium]|nr:hypothetical protein [Porticoccaceae bacterium]